MADNIFNAIFGSDDPATADSTGLTSGDRRQVGFGGISQMGALLMAAGEPQWGNERARYLAALGGVPASMVNMRKSIAETKLEGTKASMAKTQLDNQQKLMTTMQSPEFQKQFEGLPPQLKAAVQAAAAAGDIKAVNQVLQMAQPKPVGDGSVLYNGYLIDPMFGTRTPLDAKGLPSGPAEAADHIGSIAGIPSADNSELQPGQRNEAWLSGISKQNPSLANMIKLYADGKMPAPSGIQMRNPRMLKIMEMVSNYDPSFDAANYPARQAFLKNMAQGQYAQTVDSANKFLNHAADYLDSYSKLNLDNGFIANVTNPAKRGYMSITHDPRMAEVTANIKPVLDEFTKFMGGKGQITDAGRKEYENILTTAQTPEEAKAAIQKMVDLMQGQLKPIADRRAEVMKNPNSLPMDFIQPGPRRALDYIQNFDPSAKSGGGRSATVRATPPGSAAVASPPVSALKEGHITTFKNGQRWTLQNGQPVQVQ